MEYRLVTGRPVEILEVANLIQRGYLPGENYVMEGNDTERQALVGGNNPQKSGVLHYSIMMLNPKETDDSPEGTRFKIETNDPADRPKLRKAISEVRQELAGK